MRIVHFLFTTSLLFIGTCAFAGWTNSLSLGGDIFVQELEARKHTTLFDLNFQYQSENIFLKASVGGIVNQEFSEYFNIAEAYFALPFFKYGKANFGRKRYTWSALDSFWKLGLTGPLWRWRPLEAQDQGLTGIFLTNFENKKKNRYLFFISPLYVPSQGPSFQRYDGRLTSSNPWFDQPVNVIDVNNNLVPLKYDIIYPEIADVVIQFSVGFMTEFNFSENNMIRLSYLNKPTNELILPFDGTIGLNLQANIDVHPVVARHQLVNAEWEHVFAKDNKVVLSGLYETAVTFGVDTRWTYPVYKDFLTSGLYWQLPVSSSQLAFGVVYSDASSVSTGGALGGGNQTAYPYRNHYSQALSSRWSEKWLNESLTSNAEITYSLLSESLYIRSTFSYAYSAKLSFKLSIGVLGSSSPELQQSDLLAKYQNHDHLTVGANYVF